MEIKRLKVLEASPEVCFWDFIASERLLEAFMEVPLLDGRSPATVACGNIPVILAVSTVEGNLAQKGFRKPPAEATTQLRFITKRSNVSFMPTCFLSAAYSV